VVLCSENHKLFAHAGPPKSPKGDFGILKVIDTFTEKRGGISIFRFVIMGLLIFALFCYADNTSFLLLNDSAVSSCTRGAPFNCKALRSVLKSSKKTSKSILVARYLDSLGFFQAVWDTLSNDSIRINPGYRSQIVSETIAGVDSSILSSFDIETFPYFYDAGRIRQRADRLSRLMANNGFPFAKVTINIKPVEQNALTVEYVVFTDQTCHFAAPSFYGPFVTKEKILLKDFSPQQGQIFNMQKIIDFEKRLKKRPYIKNVTLSTPEIDSSFDQQEAIMVTVPIFIEDRSGVGLEGTAGFTATNESKPALFGNLMLSLVNVLRTGESALFEYTGDKTRQQLKIEFSKPWLLNLPLALDGAMELEVLKDQYGFLSAQMAIFSEIGTWWRMGVGANVSETTPRNDSLGEHGTFYGADFILATLPQETGKGLFSRELIIKSGSGVARKDKNYSRTRIEFLMGTHLPLFSWQALRLRLVSKHLITKEQNLIAAEKFRTGGCNSIRGYTDNEFAFRTLIYGQVEYLMYFTGNGAVYIFSDGGVGFEQKIELNGNYSSMLGYGVGIRLPSKIGIMTMEWARNMRDHKSLGRIHVRFQNELALNSGKILSKF